MAHTPRFGVLVLPNSDWSEILRCSKHVEDLGFDLVTTADHFVDWTDPSRLCDPSCSVRFSVSAA